MFKLKVLVADDEPDILELICEELSHRGHSCYLAGSGNFAIDLLKKDTSIDVIISDYKMPDGNGMAILDYIRTSMKHPPLFFFVSGQADVSIEECLKKGAKGFISKPFDIDGLITEIEKEFCYYTKCNS